MPLPRRSTATWGSWLALLTVLASASAGELVDGFAVSASSHRMRVNEAFEARLALPTDYGDPLDPEEIRVEAVVSAPSRQHLVPCYLDVPYQRSLEHQADGRMLEVLRQAGPPVWKLRFTPVEPGRHGFEVRARDRRGAARSRPFGATADRARAPGYTRIDPSTSFPSRENGLARPVLGTNLCWGGPGGTFDYDTWLTRMGGAGVDFARLWLWSPARTFDLEAVPHGDGRFAWDLANAWRLEYVLDRGQRQGLNFVLTVCPVPMMPGRDEKAWNRWPYAVANGGPLQRAEDFFSSPEARRLTKHRLRYLLARFAGYPNLSAFEFAARAAQGTPELVSWLNEMAAYVRALDPAQRPLCTSTTVAAADAIRPLRAIDFITLEVSSPEQTAASVRHATRLMNRPTLVSAWGYGDRARALADPAGEQLHDALLAGIMSGGLGGAMPWWWDSMVHQRDLYARFRAVARFLGQVRWNDLKPTAACHAEQPGYETLALSGGGRWVIWVRPVGAAPRPVAVVVDSVLPGQRHAMVYDPWTGQWLPPTSLQHVAGGHRIGLPTGQRDLLVYVTNHAPSEGG